MRLALSATLLALSISVLAIVATSKHLFAQEAAACETLDGFITTAEKYGGELEIRDADFLAEYHKALGVDLPGDTQARRMFYAVGTIAVAVGLIEPDGCVRYTMIVTHEAHAAVLLKIDRAA